MTVLHYIHHAAFSLNDGKTTLLFDPYLENNPEGLSSGDLKADYIFISHFHGDHVGEAYAIAKRTEALIITTAEIANDAKAHGLNAHAMHIGGSHEFPFGKVKLTLAFHGSGIAGGHACGFIVHFDGSVFYFAGDTGLFADMELIGKRNAIDYAFLPSGDTFTMGPDDAAYAAGLLKAKTVIPIHYNTWPLIDQDPEEFKNVVEKETSSKVLIVPCGTRVDL